MSSAIALAPQLSADWFEAARAAVVFACAAALIAAGPVLPF